MRFSADELLVPLIPLFGMLLLTSATRASESESIPAPILSLQIHKCCTVIESAFAQVNRTRMFSVLGRRSLKFCPSSYERPSITNAAITVPRTLAPIYMTLRSGPCSRSISCLVGALRSDILFGYSLSISYCILAICFKRNCISNCRLL